MSGKTFTPAAKTSARPGHPPALRHRDVLAIAIPIILANVTTPLIGIVDTAVLGQLGDPFYIGAVAFGGVIFSLVYWAFGFLRMGTTGLTAQARGAGDETEVAASLARALLIAAAGGLALVALQQPISLASFGLVGGSEAVETGAKEYFDIRIWGAPAALANYALFGWFIGRGEARIVLALTLLLNGINVVLDAFFVMGLEMGVAGVALGTLIAEVAAALVGLMLALRAIARAGVKLTPKQTLDRKQLIRVFNVNADIMIRTLCLVFAFAWFAAKSAEAGDLVLAANAVLINFLTFSSYLLDGFAFSAETLVGQAVGADRKPRFRQAVRLTSIWAVVLGGGLSLIYWFAGGFFIDFLTVNPEVRSLARAFLLWVALSPITGVACFQLDGIFIGATRTADMRNMMILSLGFYLAAWWALTPEYGNYGLWGALILFFIVRALTLGSRYPALERASFPDAVEPKPA